MLEASTVAETRASAENWPVLCEAAEAMSICSQLHRSCTGLPKAFLKVVLSDRAPS